MSINPSFKKFYKWGGMMLWLIVSSFAMGNNAGHEEDTSAYHTREYRALVYIDDVSLNGRYGGEREFRKKLETLFHDTTRFWNNSENNFNYYYRFVPAGLRIYPHKIGESYEEYANEAKGPLDSQFDFVLFLCLAAPRNTMACGGTSHGHSVVWCTKTLEIQEKEGDIFQDGSYSEKKLGTYSNLGHEYGHVRGATDLYQYGVKPKNNPVNGQEFKVQPCNMGTGTWIWSDYASAVFNYTADWKRLPPDYAKRRFPESIEITVSEKGKLLEGATVTLYGVRGMGGEKNLPGGDNGPDVYEKPFRVFKTNKAGKVRIDDVYHLYQVNRANEAHLPDVLPWEYWFNFLVEARTREGKKAYAWMPDLEVQRQRMERNISNYKLDVVFH